MSPFHVSSSGCEDLCSDLHCPVDLFLKIGIFDANYNCLAVGRRRAAPQQRWDGGCVLRKDNRAECPKETPQPGGPSGRAEESCTQRSRRPQPGRCIPIACAHITVPLPGSNPKPRRLAMSKCCRLRESEVG